MEQFNSELLALQGYTGISKRWLLGRNAALSTSAETIWSPGATYARLAAAVAFEAVSDSAADDTGGTGAITVEALMVDGNYVETPVTITLDGTTPVAISGTYRDCNGLRVLTAGSGLTNAGNVDIRTVSGSVVYRRLTTGPLGNGRDSDFVFTIPAGYDGVLKTINASTLGAGGNLSLYLLNHSSTGIKSYLGTTHATITGVGIQRGELPPMSFGNGLKIPEKNTIELRALSSSVGDMAASAELYLFSRSVGPHSGKIQNARVR